MLRPQGFSPSRRLAPLATFRAYFIPVPLLGFTLRGFDPPLVLYVLSNAASLGAYPYNRPCVGLPSGTHTPEEGRNPGPVIGRVDWSACLLGFHHSEVSYPWRMADALNIYRPLSRFSGAVAMLTAPLASQGFFHQGCSHSFSRTAGPPCGFPPLHFSRLFGRPAGLGYFFPLRGFSRRRELRPLLHPAIRLPA